MALDESIAQQADYPSYQEFLAFSKEQDNAPSYSNLFSVHFASPRILLPSGIGSRTKRLTAETGDLRKLLNYYCNSANLPSKQVTTGQVVNVGSAVKYPTGTAYSQMNLSFIVPRSQYSRQFFERWTQRMAPDSNQYVEFYDDLICPALRVYKWERGGGDYVYTDPRLINALRKAGDPFLLARKYKLTACWEIRNCFPYNIGSIQLNNDSSRALTMTIGFLYERYRLITEDDFQDPGRRRVGEIDNSLFSDPPATSGISLSDTFG